MPDETEQKVNGFIDIKAERRYLGYLLVDNGLIHEPPLLREDDFSDPLHGKIFAAVRAAVSAGRRADATALRIHFQADPDCARRGGPDYLGKLAATVGSGGESGDDARHYAENVQATALRRRLQALGDKLKVKAPASAPLDLLGYARAEIEALEEHARVMRSSHAPDVIDRIADELLRPSVAHSCGIRCLDASMGGGFRPRRTYGFHGQSGKGKSLLLGTFCYQLDRDRVPHFYASAEMDERELEERLVARELGISSEEFMTLDQRRREELSPLVREARKRIGHYRHYLSNRRMTVEDIEREALALKVLHGIRVVLIDYFQIISGKRASENRTEFLGRVAGSIAAIAGHDLAVVVVAQTNKEGDVRSSDELLFNVDQLYRLHRCTTGDDRRGWFEPGKSRYNKPAELGSDEMPSIILDPRGPHFRDIALTDAYTYSVKIPERPKARRTGADGGGYAGRQKGNGHGYGYEGGNH